MKKNKFIENINDLWTKCPICKSRVQFSKITRSHSKTLTHIIEYRREGKTLEQIGDMLGFTKPYISLLLHKYVKNNPSESNLLNMVRKGEEKKHREWGNNTVKYYTNKKHTTPLIQKIEKQEEKLWEDISKIESRSCEDT
jgi:transcriptional regulator with XRE-family HTH domain